MGVERRERITRQRMSAEFLLFKGHQHRRQQQPRWHELGSCTRFRARTPDSRRSWQYLIVSLQCHGIVSHVDLWACLARVKTLNHTELSVPYAAAHVPDDQLGLDQGTQSNRDLVRRSRAQNVVPVRDGQPSLSN